MRSAYNETWLYNLAVVKETKRWCDQHIITKHQLENIRLEYASFLYHPNFVIRILLFVATLFALSGVTGVLAIGIADIGESALSIGAIIYGLFSCYLLEMTFIKKSNHYKSGVTEALLYHAIGFTLGGFIFLVDGNVHVSLIVAIAVLTCAAIRYLDLLSTIAAVLCFAALLFYELYLLDGLYRSIIPFAFIIVFIPVYWIARKNKNKIKLNFWRLNLLLIESISLLLIYIGGNYFVVRELSVEMMNLEIGEGEDIPFAFIFYVFTIAIPSIYLYFGIAKKDIVLIRISLLLIAFSAFTFKYYFSFGHPEITLTIAGAIVLLITLIIMNYLKTMRHGYTRDNVLTEKWTSMNAEAFIISQTLGGNQINTPDQLESGGGSFGGGGSSDSF